MSDVASKTYGKRGGYHAIHKWLAKEYGKANKCESEDCSGKSSTFHWAKRQDYDYDYQRDNFMMLCAACHRKYDMTDDQVEKMVESLIANRNTQYCRSGHKRTDENTKWGVGRSGKRIIIRCMDCFKESQERYRNANR